MLERCILLGYQYSSKEVEKLKITNFLLRRRRADARPSARVGRRNLLVRGRRDNEGLWWLQRNNFPSNFIIIQREETGRCKSSGYLPYWFGKESTRVRSRQISS